MHSVNLLAFPLFDRLQRFFNGPHPHVEKHDVSFTLMKPATHPKPEYTITNPPTSMNIPEHIPDEIVLRILESAYDPQDLPSSQSFLASCALVNRDWSVLSQKLLFRHITLRSQASFHSLTDALNPSTARGQMLADAVTGLRVVMDHNQPNAVSPTSFAHIVSLCPRLQELDLSLFGRGLPGHDEVGSPALARMRRTGPLLDEKTLAVLRSGASITRLAFSNWTDDASTLSQLLHVWPSVHTLAITGSPPAMPPQASPAFPCALQDLRINCQRAPSFEFLKWLLQNSTGTLRRVQADRESCAEVLSRVVREHQSSIQSVSLPTCTTREAASSLMQCCDLRQLRVEDARVIMVVCDTLPLSLEHIAFGVHRCTEMKPLLDLISSSHNTGLHAVTLHLYKCGELHNKLDVVRIACALQGISLDIVRDIHEFRSVSC
ncbi:hypothetical protein EIP91_011824 [Steccherinum ochraceum]|uniref:F-box domain-containing protein n=1 Tax=Steccherinum ochraceum TaxID=92696 RepID=A0A4R0RHC7_9APHY|nr:hypothetical protein EIP91_011824 [Steccherinum ochraceum]